MAMYLEKCFCIHCRYGIEVCFGAFVLQYVAVCCSACSAYLHDDAAIIVHLAHAHGISSGQSPILVGLFPRHGRPQLCSNMMVFI